MPVLRSIFLSLAAIVLAVVSFSCTIWIGTIALKAALFPLAVVTVLVELSIALLLLPALVLGSVTIAAMVTAPFVLLGLGLKVATLGFVP